MYCNSHGEVVVVEGGCVDQDEPTGEGLKGRLVTQGGKINKQTNKHCVLYTGIQSKTGKYMKNARQRLSPKV